MNVGGTLCWHQGYFQNNRQLKMTFRLPINYRYSFVGVLKLYNYGKDAVTPNMHMHGHLAECLLEYGPVILLALLFRTI